MIRDILSCSSMIIIDLCIFLLFYEVEALNALKTYKAEVDKQKEKTINIVKWDKGKEYYGRYMGRKKDQMLGSFTKFIKENGTPQWNVAAQRR